MVLERGNRDSARTRSWRPRAVDHLGRGIAAVRWYAARRPGQEHRACPQGIQGRDQGSQVRQPTAQPWTWSAYPDRNRLSAAAAGQLIGAAAQQRHLPAAAAGQPRSPPALTCAATPEAYSLSCHVFDDQGPADPLQLEVAEAAAGATRRHDDS